MKTNLSALLATAAAGVSLVAISNASFLANLSGEIVMSALAAAALLAIAISDYSRRVRPLTIRAAVLRPVAIVANRNSTAYSIRRSAAIVEHAA